MTSASVAQMRILLIEDNPADARLIELALGERSPGPYRIVAVETLAAAKERLEASDFDVVLCDLGLPDGQGLLSLKALLPHAAAAVVVVLTGLEDDEAGTQAILLGAQDYLVKESLSPALLWRTVRHALERRDLQRQLERQAFSDQLTGLPNRRFLEDRFEQMRRAADREGVKIALLYLDMDRFKNINDRFGHPVGDELLIQVAKRLQGTIRGRDIVTRIGGDEFAFLLFGADGSGVSRVVERVLAAFNVHYKLGERQLSSAASIGVAFYPEDAGDFTELFRQADFAMYRAKTRGGSVAYYDLESDRELQERLWVEEELPEALRSEQFVLHYQPIYDLGTGEVVKAEALVRWNHPERGMISPGTFIPIAEDTGFIAQLDLWILERALTQAEAHGLAVAVNLSPESFKDLHLPERVMRMIQRSGLDPHRLCLELTEQIVAEPDRTLQTIERLHAFGVQIAIDDFGTGYSSLSYLSRYPLDILKVDASFIRSLEHDEKSKTIARAVIGLAQSLNVKTVAEGIETDAQLFWVKREGCTMGQGFLFARPAPITELV